MIIKIRNFRDFVCTKNQLNTKTEPSYNWLPAEICACYVQLGNKPQNWNSFSRIILRVVIFKQMLLASTVHLWDQVRSSNTRLSWSPKLFRSNARKRYGCIHVFGCFRLDKRPAILSDASRYKFSCAKIVKSAALNLERTHAIKQNGRIYGINFAF